jgi:hypothetical protein
MLGFSVSLGTIIFFILRTMQCTWQQNREDDLGTINQSNHSCGDTYNTVADLLVIPSNEFKLAAQIMQHMFL